MTWHRLAGAIAALRQRPLLFILVAASLFAAASLTVKALAQDTVIEAKLRVDSLAIDGEADDLASLIAPAPFGPDHLLTALGGQADADGSGQTSPAPWREQLTVERDDDGLWTIRLKTDHGPSAAEQVSERLQALIDRLNQQRTSQRQQVAIWIERRRAFLKAKIDDVKTAIVQSPFNPEPFGSESQSESERLLKLFIGAAREAQSARQASDRAGTRSGDAPVSNQASLASDVQRMADALSKLEQGRAEQLRQGTALKDAEAALADLDDQVERVMAEGGVLHGPAATLTAPAAMLKQGLLSLPPSLGPILLPALAILSLLAALFTVMAACGRRQRADRAANDYLNDPNWPLPAQSRRDQGAAFDRQAVSQTSPR